MSNWRLLLDRTIRGLDTLREHGSSVPDWVLGGGTALMIHAGHRLSKDIDAFIDDPQYLGLLSPETSDIDAWNSRAHDRAANFLKLHYDEGEIDFIVAASISGLAAEDHVVDLTSVRAGAKPTIRLEPPAEIALKKMHYRASMLKARDIFDIAVVDAIAHQSLIDNLHQISPKKDELVRRLTMMNEDFICRELAELEIQPAWMETAESCIATIRAIVDQIPEPVPSPGI